MLTTLFHLVLIAIGVPFFLICVFLPFWMIVGLLVIAFKDAEKNKKLEVTFNELSYSQAWAHDKLGAKK